MKFKKYILPACLFILIALYAGVFYVYGEGFQLLRSGIREVVETTMEEDVTVPTTLEPVFTPTYLDIRSLVSQRYLFTLTKEIEGKLYVLNNTGTILDSTYDTFPSVYQSGSDFIFAIGDKNIEIPQSSYFLDIWNRKKSTTVSGENIVSGEGFGTGKITQKNIKKIALTFDDGPNPKYTNQLLDILKNEKVPVTFYVLGNKAEEYPDMIQRAYNEGHEIGSHSYKHDFLSNRSVRDIQEDLYKTDQAIYQAISTYPKTFRPPYGGVSTGMIEKASMPIVLWSVDPHDWKTLSKSKNIAAIKHIKDGDIIIMHDIHEVSINSITDMIHIIRDQGFTFVTVSELLGTTEKDTKVGKICYKKGNCK
ncbi:polysaccharide deacetylase family protein [Candidatus Gracilibacteria bacterium]|nr:polysaccharide deacetylase family protein [Candidatus Gracilibacteria bacterium]